MTTESDWIPHDGGSNPVREGETLVAYRLRDGRDHTTRLCNDGSGLHWKQDGKLWDITHYRVTPPRASMSAEEVLVRAREAAYEEVFSPHHVHDVRKGEYHPGSQMDKTVRAILAFHRDLSKPLAEVAPHTVDDADERAAYEIYRKHCVSPVSFADRMASTTYCVTLAAYRAGKAAR